MHELVQDGANLIKCKSLAIPNESINVWFYFQAKRRRYMWYGCAFEESRTNDNIRCPLQMIRDSPRLFMSALAYIVKVLFYRFLANRRLKSPNNLGRIVDADEYGARRF